MTRKYTAVALAALVALTLAGAACGSDGTTDASTAPDLDGTEWVLTAMSGGPPLAGTTVSARFGNGTLSGHSGCNTYRAPFRQRGADLTIGTDIVRTQIACPPPLSTVEDAFLAHLEHVTTFTASDRVLRLRDGSGTTVLRFRSAPGRDAIQGDWRATTVYTGTALESVQGELTATFDAAGIHGNAGCNTYTGDTVIDGSDITIGPLASTLRACADESEAALEGHFTQALETARTFEIVGDRLSLFREDGGYAVILERA